jgi:hypothetical protein
MAGAARAPRLAKQPRTESRNSFVPPYLNHHRVEQQARQRRFSDITYSKRRTPSMSGHVERVLGEIGQSLRPMGEAPRDGRSILAKSAAGFVVCCWDAEPLKLAGPAWVEAHDAEFGYLDTHFVGWLDPATLKLWDYATLAELLIAYIEDARAGGDAKALAILERCTKLD